GGIPRKIDEIDFDFVGRPRRRSGSSGPFGVCQARLNGDFSCDLLVIPIGRGAAFCNLSPSRGHSRGEEQRRHQLRFAGAAVADNANVANVLGGIALHRVLRILLTVRRSLSEARLTFLRGPAPGKLQLREENAASAPGSPLGGGGEGLMSFPGPIS